MQIKDKVLDVPVIQGGMGVGVSLSSLGPLLGCRWGY